MSDTKDWSNIRIEESVRDAARDDPRTYTEIMRAGLEATTKLPCGCGNYALWCGDTGAPESIDAVCPKCGNHFGYGQAEADTDALREQLDRIEAAATAAEDRTGSIQKQLEDMSR